MTTLTWLVRSCAQSMKHDRNPCTVTADGRRRCSACSIAMCANGRPLLPANTCSPLRRGSACKIANARSPKGIRCSRLAFILVAGIVHVRLMKSNSDQVALRVSEVRVAQRIASSSARADAIAIAQLLHEPGNLDEG